MSYALSSALQSAVYQHLISDPAVIACVGDRVYDVPPTGHLPDLYVLIGQEDVRDASDYSCSGAWHDLTLSIISNSTGFMAAKETAAALNDALQDADMSLHRGRLVGIRFRKAKAARAKEGQRKIDMIFPGSCRR